MLKKKLAVIKEFDFNKIYEYTKILLHNLIYICNLLRIIFELKLKQIFEETKKNFKLWKKS